jgi:hypothetical protein
MLPVAPTTRTVIEETGTPDSSSFLIEVVVMLKSRSRVRTHFGEVAIPVGSSHASIHEEVAARNEPALRAHKQRADRLRMVSGEACVGETPAA